MTQRYNSKLALGRMEKGLCPECGGKVSEHTGFGGLNGCMLTDNGVHDRIEQYRKDKEVKLPVSNFAEKKKRNTGGEMQNKYLARCSRNPCKHLTPFELKSQYHCENKRCPNYRGKCEQHSADGVKLLDARLKREK